MIDCLNKYTNNKWHQSCCLSSEHTRMRILPLTFHVGSSKLDNGQHLFTWSSLFLRHIHLFVHTKIHSRFLMMMELSRDCLPIRRIQTKIWRETKNTKNWLLVQSVWLNAGAINILLAIYLHFAQFFLTPLFVKKNTKKKYNVVVRWCMVSSTDKYVWCRHMYINKILEFICVSHLGTPTKNLRLLLFFFFCCWKTGSAHTYWL